MMHLSLCSSAAPDATLSGLFEACARRGLAALELREGDAHGLNSEYEEPMDAVAAAQIGAARLPIVAYRSSEPGHHMWLARLSEALDAPVLLDGPSTIQSRLERAADMSELGARVAIVIRGDDYLSDAREVAGADVDLAWDADPTQGTMGDRLARLLDGFAERLRHVRLLGSGPEAALHEGQGIGEVMGRLALSGYSGSVALAPSSTRYRVAWQTWLGRRGGWGCGGRTSDPSLVQLSSVGTVEGDH